VAVAAAAAADGAEDDLNPEFEEDEVGDHLAGHHGAGNQRPSGA
jgi:hypothetical protein